MSYLWLSLVAATLTSAAALVPGPAVISAPGLAAAIEQVEPTPAPSALAVELHKLAPDPAPPKLTNDKHYLISNERRLDLWRKDLEGTGGIYVGVGAGQNYTLAGWARPDLMVLVDFDEDVVDIHSVYGLFFAYAKTPEQFTALWTEEGEEMALSVIDLGEFSKQRRARLKALYKRARKYIEKRHELMFTKYESYKTPWVLSDADQYDHVADLVRRGEVVAFRGDFTKPGVLLALGEALTRSERKIGTLYLSNIEMYFMYGKSYKANMLGLPLDEDTVVLRTLPVHPSGWEFMVQAGDNFHRWVGHAQTHSVYTVRGRDRPYARNGRAVLDEEPPRKRKTGT